MLDPNALLHAEYAELHKRYPLRIGVAMADNAENAMALMRAIAQLRGGQLLSSEYRGNGKRYRFRCDQHHEWEVQAANLRLGSWCPQCNEAWKTSRHPLLDRSAKLRAAANQHGLTSPETEWRGWTAPHVFVCPHGHSVTTRPATVIRQWECPDCHKAAGLARLQRKAAEHGGVCLSDTYDGLRNKYRFRCAKGHEWAIHGQAVIMGRWCRVCNAEHPSLEGLQRLQRKAAEYGGVCLSETYTRSDVKYRFRCAEGHEWNALASMVHAGSWCKACYTERQRLHDGLERLRKAAAARGGVCLSDSFHGVMKRYRFRCSYGHEWETAGSCLLRGSWCRKCATLRSRNSIEDAQRIANERGGKCLSTEYHRCMEKLTWECLRGHVWQAAYDSVRSGNWCSECAHLAQITSRKSKARKRYVASGAAPSGTATP